MTKLDPFFDTTKCIDRLYKQYLSTPRLIIAVDFDLTIFDFHNEGYEFPKIISLLKRCNNHNFYIVIFTSSKKDRYNFIEEYCKKINIKIDGINKNIVETPYSEEGSKIFFNLFLDDRSGLQQAYEILNGTLNKSENNNEHSIEYRV